MTSRRVLLATPGTLLAAPLVADGQQASGPARIGFLPLGSPSQQAHEILR